MRTTGESGSWLRTSISPATRFLKAQRHRAANEVSVAPTYVPATLLTAAPTNLIPTAAATTQIGLTWTAASGTIDHYEVERSLTATGSFNFLNNSFSTSFNDNAVTSGSIYRYRVRAVDGGGVPSAYSNVVFAMAVNFTDNPIAIGVTTIKAQHLTELRQDVNALRQYAGLSAATWTDPTLTAVTIKVIHLQELRDRLGEALTALNMISSAYTDPTLTAGTTTIKTIHVDELRQRVSRGVSSVAGGGPTFSDLANSRLDPRNQTGGGGENPLSGNYNWPLPLVGLPGRAGLDLSLNLSYNSLLWTKNGNYISFDDDSGFPAPGFRLGFAVIQPLYYNTEVGKYAYLLISSDGSRTELRQVATNSYLFESADSSHLLLDTTNLSAGDPSMLLRTTDGTQLTYKPKGGAYQCTEIKSSNGNLITVNYNVSGRISNIHDTLDRVINFNYDANGWLTSITQQWKRQPPNQAQVITHTWASFAYTDLTIQTNFNGLTLVGVSNGSIKKVLSKVTLADNSTTPAQNSHFDFDYTSYGQVWKISNFAADNHLLKHRAYRLPGSPLWSNPPAQNDCPRFTERRDWAQNWNRLNETGPEQEAITTFSAPEAGVATVPWGQNAQNATFVQVTNPDGTFSRIYFLGTAGSSTGWRIGLPYLVDSFDVGGTIPQRQAATIWEQDNESVSYVVNPRVTETNIYDPAGNRKRTAITYQSFTPPTGGSYKLSGDVLEYAADGDTVLRSSRTLYVDADSQANGPYLSRRILGLVREKTLYEGNVNTGGTLKSRLAFFYDNENGASSIQGTDAPVQHDNANYSASFVTGRANLSTTKRYNVDNGQFTSSTMKYNTAGAVVSSKDALLHETKIEYTDAFSDNVSRNTLAYPTKVTDADNYFSRSWYNFDFGAVTKTRTPPPNVTGTQDPNAGPETNSIYDDLGRLERNTNSVNSAYKRFEYAEDGIRVDAYATIQEGQGEARTFQITDGAGRAIASGWVLPLSIGGYGAQRFIYDVMGRVVKTSNPTETSASGNNPSAWMATGDDGAAGWLFTQQSYDWKGRPLVTTNPDTTTRQASYSGCGCAGGEVVTLTDEAGRRQKVHSDVLGRQIKFEVLNWNDSPYSTRTHTYNARDQITSVKQFQGLESSGVYQEIEKEYDGYGRLIRRKDPVQTTATTYTYNADSQPATVTDARGVTQTFTYNSRELPTNVSYSGSSAPLAPVIIEYDAGGNRTSMTDGTGSTSYQYNQLSQLISETRQFTGLSGNYTLSYEYNLAGALKAITDHVGSRVDYAFNNAGNLTSVSGSGPHSVPTYASNFQYRAWGGINDLDFGNGAHQHHSFNSRLQNTSMSLSNGSISATWTFDYYGDGKIQKVTDSQNPIFDRAFDYDHIGRLQEVKTGAEARGGTTADGPFKQTYNYDVWENTTSRSYRLWTQSPQSDAASFTNNRRQGWSYDEEGNLGSDSGAIYGYDAAGRQNQFIADVYVGGWPTQYPLQSVMEISQTFDGNSATAKKTTINRREEYINQEWQVQEEATITYYVRSTALGGKVIAELDEAGAKRKGYVFAGGMRIATHYVWSNTSNSSVVEWTSASPATGSEYMISGSGIARKELDPLGADVTNPPSPSLITEPVFYNPRFDQMALEIEGGPSEEYEQANRDRAALMADLIQALHDREQAEKLWQAGKRDDAMAILQNNPNVGIEYRALVGDEVVQSGSLFGKDAADFLNGLNTAVAAGQLSPLTSSGAYSSHHAGANPQEPREVQGRLDQCIKRLLAKFFDKHLLNAIRIDRDSSIVPPTMDAITIGDNIYFREGAYDPSTLRGITLLAHEIEHSKQYRAVGTGTFLKTYTLSSALVLSNPAGLLTTAVAATKGINLPHNLNIYERAAAAKATKVRNYLSARDYGEQGVRCSP